jgi:lipopolysaccharide/colanic/teichoic acid biosynthesis glycosyltransferase
MIGQVPILGGLGDFRRVLARLRLQGMAPARVIVTGPHHLVGLDAVRRLQREAYAERVVVTNLPDLLSFRSGRTDAAAAAARLRQPAFQRPSYALAKRGADIAVAGLGLVLGMPLIAAVALLTAVGVGTPVLFRQARLGRGRRPFVLYKFCTMRELYGEDGRPLPDALRTTAVGRFLRRTRLDELPQLWNVLVGDMALVGPRPLLARDLATMPDGGRERSGVRPGITGWAQVHGGQLLGGDAKLALDLWYVRHASLGLDARILLLTLRMVLQGDRVDAPAVERAKAFLQSA